MTAILRKRRFPPTRHIAARAAGSHDETPRTRQLGALGLGGVCALVPPSLGPRGGRPVETAPRPSPVLELPTLVLHGGADTVNQLEKITALAKTGTAA